MDEVQQLTSRLKQKKKKSSVSIFIQIKMRNQETGEKTEPLCFDFTLEYCGLE